MYLYYHNPDQGNFGDDMNAWIWNELLGDTFDDDKSQLFLGIGTIINQHLPKTGKKIVMGSGYGYGRAPVIDETYEIFFVRGPKTADALDIDPKKAITDPAYLVKTLVPKPTTKKHKYSYIPHISGAKRGNWAEICEIMNINYIDVRWPYLKVIDEIINSEFVITEALHGAIIADAYGIPWCATIAYDQIFQFKWEDWSASIGMDYTPVRIPQLWSMESNTRISRLTINKVKRSLKFFNVEPSNWTPPPKPNTSRKVKESICDQIGSIISHGDFKVSSSKIVEDKIRLMETELANFKNTYQGKSK